MMYMSRLEQFANEHKVTDYVSDGLLHTISFKVDGVEYLLSPFFEDNGTKASHPSGYHVVTKLSRSESWNFIFSFHTYIDDEVTDIYSKTYCDVCDYVKDEPTAEPENFVPYAVWVMVKLCLLTEYLPYYDFFSYIDMESEGVGSLVMGRKGNKEIRQIIHNRTEDLKSRYPWIHFHEGTAQQLFEYIVEHFVRYAYDTADKSYIQTMGPLIDFIQTRTKQDFTDMIRSYPEMEDITVQGDFEKSIHILKKETRRWISVPENIDSSILISEYYEKVLFLNRCGLARGWRTDELSVFDSSDDTCLHSELGYCGAENIRPSKEDVIIQIKSSPFGRGVDLMQEGDRAFNIRFEREVDDATAHVSYSRSEMDGVFWDSASVEFVPKYVFLDKEETCQITNEALNGFDIQTCIRNENSDNGNTSLKFLGQNQEDSYVNDLRNIRTISLQGLLRICPDAASLIY